MNFHIIRLWREPEEEDGDRVDGDGVCGGGGAEAVVEPPRLSHHAVPAVLPELVLQPSPDPGGKPGVVHQPPPSLKFTHS